MKLKQKDTEDLEIDMSPMIDMVFLLLIFFIVASQIIDEKPQVAVPSAAYGKVPEDTTGRLMISVTKDEKYYIGADPAPKTIDEIKTTIAQWLEADPKLRILIRADGDVKYKINEEITIACAEVGAQDLIYSVFEE
ncbi:ExbD/TolR family protein [Pontiella sp.]|uniref:ExbD/TolR family protein n=1 Tax=Pontiella sp. TaxID=2837462 RepID=UPI003563500C